MNDAADEAYTALDEADEALSVAYEASFATHAA